MRTLCSKRVVINFGGLVLVSLLGLLLAQMIVAAPPLPHTLLGEVRVGGLRVTA